MNFTNVWAKIWKVCHPIAKVFRMLLLPICFHFMTFSLFGYIIITVRATLIYICSKIKVDNCLLNSILKPAKKLRKFKCSPKMNTPIKNFSVAITKNKTFSRQICVFKPLFRQEDKLWQITFHRSFRRLRSRGTDVCTKTIFLVGNGLSSFVHLKYPWRWQD